MTHFMFCRKVRRSLLDDWETRNGKKSWNKTQSSYSYLLCWCPRCWWVETKSKTLPVIHRESTPSRSVESWEPKGYSHFVTPAVGWEKKIEVIRTFLSSETLYSWNKMNKQKSLQNKVHHTQKTSCCHNSARLYVKSWVELAWRAAIWLGANYIIWLDHHLLHLCCLFQPFGVCVTPDGRVAQLRRDFWNN